MKKLLGIAIIFCFIFLLFGCSSINSGMVVEKSYTPSRRIYQPMTMYINKQVRLFPRWINSSERWSILIENDGHREWWAVSEEYYNSVNIGDYVSRNKEE